MPKRIILLLDGTWNNWESGDNDTNIVRLEDLIVRSLESWGQASPTPVPESAPGADSRSIVEGYKTDGCENFVLYQRGVGTGWSDALKGGIFGIGLHDNIRRAYKFLSYHYEPNDQVFIFGFSRGAYTARSLVGYIADAGLLKRDCCSRELEEMAWCYYRTNPADRLPAVWSELTPHVHDRTSLKIACIGVFDTVGSLGIPLGTFKLRNRQKYEFHNVQLSSITKVNLHALAIDEHRQPFEAAIWRKPKYKKYESKTEQVWFPGVHSDIGGGYISAHSRNGASLDDLTFNWMVNRVKHHYPDFPVNLDLLAKANSDWRSMKQHDSRGLPYRIFYPEAVRVLANSPVKKLRRRQRNVSYDRRDGPIGEAVHVSALQRLGRRVPIGPRSWQSFYYRPANLLAVLDEIEATYRDNKLPGIQVVNWDGTTIATGDPASATPVINMIEEAKARLTKPLAARAASPSGSGS